MATLEDKILGEKLHNYCSSSSGSDDDGSEDESKGKEVQNTQPNILPTSSWSGTATNTGPKGVMEDWRRFKQLAAEQRSESECERIALAKKLTLEVPTSREDEKAKLNEELECELDELLDDEVLLKFQQIRMQELMSQLSRVKKYGELYNLEKQDDFLNCIDKEDPKTNVVVHIYEDIDACEIMDECLKILAAKYLGVKFCRIRASVAKLSQNFREEGVPALLVYKGGQIVGNFVQMTSVLSESFFANDVEKFLMEYGFLTLT